MKFYCKHIAKTKFGALYVPGAHHFTIFYHFTCDVHFMCLKGAPMCKANFKLFCRHSKFLTTNSLTNGSQGELRVYPGSVVRPSSGVRRPSFSKISFSETAYMPIKATFHWEPPWVTGTKVSSRHLGHLFYGKVKLCNLGFSIGNSEKSEFSETIAACDLIVGR